MNQNWDTIFKFALECADWIQKTLDPQTETFSEMKAYHKPDLSWVTEWDITIEKELRSRIENRFPTHEVFGEENGGQTLTHGQTTWILDPIDGTFSFVHGIPFFSSLLAVYEGFTPMIGIALLPGLKWSLTACKGLGVWINGAPYRRLDASPVNAHRELIAIADLHRFRDVQADGLLTRLLSAKVRTYPDALGYALLLKGCVQAFIDPKVELWDIAPFHVILPEAGFWIGGWNGESLVTQKNSVSCSLDLLGRGTGVEDILDAIQQRS